MNQVVTLQLSEAVIELAQQASQESGQALEVVLMEWLEDRAVQARMRHLVHDAEYPIYTPEESPEAAQVLREYLETVQTARKARHEET